MPRLILLLTIGIVCYIVYRRIKAIPPGQRRGAYLKLGLALLVIVVGVGLLTGRMHWIGAAATALLVGVSRLLPTLIRLFPMLQWLHGQRSAAGGAGSGQQSTVETEHLRMILDHDSGDMTGEVLSGEFSGQQLDDLDRRQLDTLLASLHGTDEDSTRLLRAYMARRFGGAQDDQSQTASSGGAMTRAEALAILGLEESATEDEINKAHKKLMQKLHPDRGGSDYLAAKLNQAKDFLLG